MTFRDVTIPEKCEPQVRELLLLMNARRTHTPKALMKAAGLSLTSLDAWRFHGCSPRVSSLEACFNVFGYTLQAIPKE